MCIEVRSEYQKGKLLFKWDPEQNIIYLVLKDMLYAVQLEGEEPGGEYRILKKQIKPSTNK